MRNKELKCEESLAVAKLGRPHSKKKVTRRARVRATPWNVLKRFGRVPVHGRVGKKASMHLKFDSRQGKNKTPESKNVAPSIQHAKHSTHRLGGCWWLCCACTRQRCYKAKITAMHKNYTKRQTSKQTTKQTNRR